MAFYVRKISRAKWPDQPCDIKELRSDAVSDIRTQNDSLSVWKIDNIDELDEAVLALAGSSKSECIETVSVIWIEDSELKGLNISIDDSEPGDTIVLAKEMDHRNLVKLTYHKMGDISKVIMKEIADNHYKRYTKGTLKAIFGKAYRENRINKEKCLPKMIAEIEKAANT